MPGLVQAVVSAELFKEAGRGRAGRRPQAPQLGQLLDGPSFDALLSPSSRGPESSDNPSRSPLPGQLLCFLNTLGITQLIQEKT